MRISESQLRRIIRSVIEENRKNAYDFSDLSPANEFRPDTIGKTSYVDTVERSRQNLNPDYDPSKYRDTVMQAKKDMYEKMKRKRAKLEKEGKKAFADELQAIFDEVLG